MERIFTGFTPVIRYALNHRALVSILAIILFIFSVFLFDRLGGEFIPQLEEGDLAAGVITLQGGSLSHTVEMVQKANKILLDSFPEVKHAVCKIGAGEIPTDPTPMETGDYIITLKPKSEWTSAKTRPELVSKMEEQLIPLAGVKFEFQQPIQMRFNELLSGSRQDIAIKIFGDDLEILADKAAEVEKIIRNTEGVEDINVEKVTGLAQVQVDYNRKLLAQYGLSVEEVNRILRTAFAGSQAGVVYEGEKRFALVVRLDKEFRQTLEDVKNLSVSLPNGGQIPFEQVATVSIKSGPAQVSRENTKRRITVGFNVRHRDVESVIGEVSRRIDDNIRMPAGYYVDYGGQFRNLEAAKARLAVALPVALLLIFILLCFAFRSAKQALLIYTAVPLAAIGGVLALWFRGMNFSISAGVGFIALFGVAVLNGIVLIAEFNRLEKEEISDIRERILTGLRTRLRPVLMTAAVASLGFLPMALSVSAGAEVQKPLATVVIGGLISATLLTLVVLPVFYSIFSGLSFGRLFRGKHAAGIISIVLLAALVTLPAMSFAQSKRSVRLEEAIRVALDSNLTIHSARLSVGVAQAMKGASWDIPGLAVEGQYGQFNSREYDNSLSISQSFAFPTVYISQRKLAGANIQSSELQLQSVQLEIATQVKQVYWQLTYLYSKKQLLKYQDSLYHGFLRAAERRAMTGETNRLEMITARSQSMEVKNQLQQTEADLIIAQRKLQILMHSHSMVVPADTVLRRITFLAPSDSLSAGRNPYSAFYRQQAEVARLEKSVEKNRMIPDFSVGYFSQTMLGEPDPGTGTGIAGRGDRFAGLKAGISIPVWFWSPASKVRAAGLRHNVARVDAENYDEALQGSYRNLMDEKAKFGTSLDYYENQAVPEADLIIVQTTKSYRAGELDYLDYTLNLNRALGIRYNYLDALNNYNQTIIAIESITGKIL